VTLPNFLGELFTELIAEDSHQPITNAIWLLDLVEVFPSGQKGFLYQLLSQFVTAAHPVRDAIDRVSELLDRRLKKFESRLIRVHVNCWAMLVCSTSTVFRQIDSRNLEAGKRLAEKD
jgi:hypothetical protein